MTDKPINPDAQDKTLEEHAADLGELVIQRERQETMSIRDHQQIAKLKQMIAQKERLLRRMLNGDEEEYVPMTPKRPRLRIVK